VAPPVVGGFRSISRGVDHNPSTKNPFWRKDMPLPVGSIVASILSAEDFATVVPHGEVWKLANGEPVPHGALLNLMTNKPYYKSLIKNNVAVTPDLRGVFLRGQNSGHANLSNPRADGHQNPDNVDVGGYQDDDLGPHQHPILTGFQNSGTAGGQGPVWQGSGGTSSGPPSSDANHTRAETHPRNVTVNYFIRVA